MVGIGLPGGPAPAPSSGFPVWQVSAVVGALLAGLTALAVRARRRSDGVRVMRLTGSRRVGAVGALAFMLAVDGVRRGRRRAVGWRVG